MKSLAEDLIIGNCSECGGPVIEKEDISIGKYKECQNCKLKLFPSYDKVIIMKDKKDSKKNTEKTVEDLWKDMKFIPYPANPSNPSPGFWPNQPYVAPDFDWYRKETPYWTPGPCYPNYPQVTYCCTVNTSKTSSK